MVTIYVCMYVCTYTYVRKCSRNFKKNFIFSCLVSKVNLTLIAISSKHNKNWTKDIRTDVRYISTICILLCVVTLFYIPLNITFNIPYLGV